MSLTRKFDFVEMAYPCPGCGHELRKPGRWFVVVPRFRCEGCGVENRLTYDVRVKLQRAFEAKLAPIEVRSPIKESG